MSFYELSDDINLLNRWYLGDVAFIDNWDLLSRLDSELEYDVQLCKVGKEMDFTCNEAYGVCIVSDSFKEALADIYGIQFAKANIIGASLRKQFYVMSITNEIECIDEEKSEFQKFEINDPVRPDKAGEYRGFFKMVVSPEKIAGNSIFRVKGFNASIVVCESVKNRLESAGISGIKFKRV
ncbi:imm11 family protein [Vibrio europaeus]|uniref:imm11 family protein n=1 Tax=Vibrio europaeus TaxID=300876 RepID=UPI00148B6440|nr:DUF1629 domain-containing protein [Vibrio europaeus]